MLKPQEDRNTIGNENVDESSTVKHCSKCGATFNYDR